MVQASTKMYFLLISFLKFFRKCQRVIKESCMMHEIIMGNQQWQHIDSELPTCHLFVLDAVKMRTILNITQRILLGQPVTFSQHSTFGQTEKSPQRQILEQQCYLGNHLLSTGELKCFIYSPVKLNTPVCLYVCHCL